MVIKKKAATKKKKKKSAGKPASQVVAAHAQATPEPVVPAESVLMETPVQRISVPAQDFQFGSGKKIFPEDRPIIGSDIERLKDESNYDLNTIEATLGISRRDYYYELRDNVAEKKLPDISMAILMRLYEKFPKELLPFQPLDWAAYLTIIGVHPGEFAQLVGRAANAGRSWQQGGKPIRSVQLIIAAFWRAGVTDTSHPVYQEFLKVAEREAELRGEILEVKKAPTVRRKRRKTKALVEAENSMMQPVDD